MRGSFRFACAVGAAVVLAAGCSVVNAPDDPFDPTGTGGSGLTGGEGGAPPECEEASDCPDDGDTCTIETCDGGTCGATTVDPDDADACTADSCDASGAVVNEAIDPDDANPCTFDACDPAIGVTNLESLTLFEEDFSDGGTDWMVQGQWGFGPAKPSPISQNGSFRFAHDPAEDHSPSADEMLAGIVIGGFPDVATVTPTQYLESPVFDATVPGGSVIFSYWRYLASDYAPYMINTVEVWDGTTWQPLFSSGPEPGWHDSGWTLVEHDVTAFANPQMKVRFGFQVGNASAFLDAPSWSVDDVRVGNLPVLITDDANTCTADVCDPSSGSAVNEPIALDDANPCTEDLCDPARGVTHHDTSIRFWSDFGVPQNSGFFFSTAEEWQVGPAMAGAGDPAMDTSPTDDNGVGGVVLGGPYNASAPHGYFYLTSNSGFDGTQLTPGTLELRFQRWLNTPAAPFASNRVEVYNGTAWIVIWEGDMMIQDNAWQEIIFNLASLAAPNMQVRFGFAVPQPSSIPFGGWNVDDVMVRDLSCMGM